MGQVEQGYRGLAQEAPRAGLAGRDRLGEGLAAGGLEDRAQGLRQPVVGAAEGRGDLRGVASLDQVGEGGVVQERQVAGQHEPGGVRAGGLGRQDARGGTGFGEGVHYLGIARARGLLHLVGPHRDEGGDAARFEQPHRAVELRLAAIGEQGLVARHAATAAPGEHEPVKRRRRHRRDRAKSRLPPRFSSRRTDSITMSCDSALHMS